MQTKTVPAGTGTIFYDAFDRDIRNKLNNTIAKSSCKLQDIFSVGASWN